MNKNKVIPDAQLIAKYINGDESVLEILLQRHRDKMFGFIYSKVRNQELTEDLFQDTLFKIVRTLKKGKYIEEGKFLSWAVRIAHNIIIDYYRKQNKMKKVYESEDFSMFDILHDNSLDAEKQLIRQQLIDKIKILIERLPNDQKEVLKLRMYEELSFKEIAEKTNVSINTALGRMRYALINLRKIIDDNNILLTI
ncbi:MAG TPA: sigma-70 family RNA polymerase sigma factor [Flavobacteriales bacterium]|nr:sigma-70 family RNA polymerase sigma factor [Flavobacteriales bacterium]